MKWTAAGVPDPAGCVAVVTGADTGIGALKNRPKRPVAAENGIIGYEEHHLHA